MCVGGCLQLSGEGNEMRRGRLVVELYMEGWGRPIGRQGRGRQEVHFVSQFHWWRCLCIYVSLIG